MSLAEDVDLEEFIMSKDELTGADIKALCSESGLIALRSKSLWNLLQSLNALGKSASSAFSSLYHFFHYKESISKEPHNYAKVGISSRALIFYHIPSVKKFFNTSGIGGALRLVFPRIR